jgi:hypothetical protein
MVIALKRGGTTQNYIEIQGGTSADADNDSIVFKTGGTAAITIDNSQDVTFSGAISGTTATFTTASNDPQLILKSTDADANDGPILDLIRDSASPDANDFIGSIRFRADDSAGNETQYADIRVITNDVTDGTEDGQFNLRTMVNGSLRLRIKADPAEIVFNEESQDLDFRVESDNDTHALFVDAGNSRVGINNSSPDVALHVLTQGTSGEDGVLKIGGSSASLGLALEYDQSGSTTSTITANPSYTSDAQRLILRADGDLNTEQFVLYGNGNIVVNENSRDADFRVESDSNTHALFVDASTSRVGIGTSSLGAELCVYASDVSSYMKFTNVNNTSSGVDIGLYDNGSSSPQAVIINREVGGEIVLQDNTGTLLTLNDTEAKFNDESRNIDFRVESDSNANGFVLDAGTGKIGINSGAGSDMVAIKNTGTNMTSLGVYSSGSAAVIDVGVGGTYTTNGNDGRIVIRNQSAVDVIQLTSQGTTVFNQNSNASNDFRVESDSFSNAFIVDSSQNFVGFVDVSTAPWAQTSGQGLMTYRLTEGSMALSNNGDNGYAALYINKFNAAGDNRAISFYREGATEGHLRVDATQGVKYGTSTDGGATSTVELNKLGITFDGGSNYLDDYEEGTFYYGISLSGSGSYTPRAGYLTGRYTKIGNVVHIHLRYETSSQSSPSGDIKLTGLPFTVESNPPDGNGSGQIPILLRGDTRANVDGHFVGLTQGSTNMSLFYQSGTTFASVNAATVTGNFEGTISITYMTSQ